MEIIRCAVQNERLVPWVKFFWELDSHCLSLHQKLLPTDSIDVLINLGSPMVYATETSVFEAPVIHVNGLRNQYSFIHQSGDIHVLGIAFHPWGLYPFVRRSLSHTAGRIVDLRELSKDLAEELESVCRGDDAVSKLEGALLSVLRLDDSFVEKSDLLAGFLTSPNEVAVSAYCAGNGVTVKTFERLCVRYTGYTPVALRRIHRFQKTSNQIVHQNPANLAHVAYDNSFSDQAHLNREFKSFSGEAPRRFRRQKLSVKENVKYRYR